MPPAKDPSEFHNFDDPTDGLISASARTIFSVSELTSRIKSVLEAGFPFVWICGEISNLRTPASGHSYFTLKDETAQIAAVVFRNQNRQLRLVLEDGLSIIGLGRLSVYEPRGTYQVILEYLEPAGLGAIQLAFEKLKNRLAAEGYFDQRNKKPLPFLPAKISVITSPTGAVVHDVITVISRRFPDIWIEVVPVSVQGPRAEAEICAALKLVNERADSDIVILARGGGSLEDLQAFNSESVALAVFKSTIPVISAVGHETDVTIADFISDLRAPTPSAAAELAVPDKEDLERRLHELDRSLRNAILKITESLNHEVKQLYKRIKDPRKIIQETWMRLDDANSRLERSLLLRCKHAGELLQGLRRHLDAVAPQTLIKEYNKKIELNINNLIKNLRFLISNNSSHYRGLAINLDAINPLAILRRGYSVTRSLPDRRVVSHPDQVSINQDVEILLDGGVILSVIKGKSTYGQENI